MAPDFEIGVDSKDLVFCLEVMEHVIEPEQLARRVGMIAQGGAVISVPWEPYFRLGNLFRGKHLRRLGSSPGHIQHFTRRSLTRILAREFARFDLEVQFPWLMAFAPPERAADATG